MAIFCSEILAQSQFATISHESCLALGAIKCTWQKMLDQARSSLLVGFCMICSRKWYGLFDKSLPFCRLYIGSEDRPCFHGCAELKKSSCVQMFLLDRPGYFMIPQHYLNFETRCSIPPVLPAPNGPLDVLLALSCTFLCQWRCVGRFLHHSLLSNC